MRVGLGHWQIWNSASAMASRVSGACLAAGFAYCSNWVDPVAGVGNLVAASRSQQIAPASVVVLLVSGPVFLGRYLLEQHPDLLLRAL